MKAPSTSHPRTLLAQAGGHMDDLSGGLVPSTHWSTTFLRRDDGGYDGPVYVRDGNPTMLPVESVIARLEGGVEAMLFSSGMAASVALFSAFLPGGTIAVADDCYYGIEDWLEHFGKASGLTVHRIDCHDHAALENLLQRSRIDLLWLESMSNPFWRVADLPGIIAIAHRHGTRVAVDNTACTPLLVRPLQHGADFVMHSATKLLNGHSDVLAGALVCREQSGLWERMRSGRLHGGAMPGSMEAWLLLRGMRTLAVRQAAAAANAAAIAAMLSAHPAISLVHYPGYRAASTLSPGEELLQGRGPTVISFELHGGEVSARRFLSRLNLIQRATSFGGVESTAEHHASVRELYGGISRVPTGLVRLSVGIEDQADLLGDIAQALDN